MTVNGSEQSWDFWSLTELFWRRVSGSGSFMPGWLPHWQPSAGGGSGSGGGGTPPAQPPQTPKACQSHGFGFGALGGGTAEGGVGAAGAAATGSAGGGVYYSRPNGASAGLFAEGSAAAYAGSHNVGAPKQNGPMALGLFGGVGVGGFITNAGSNQQLSGHFLTLSGDVGTPFTGKIPVQLSVSGNNTWVLSATYGPGAGIGGSVTTNTATTGGTCP